MTPQSRGRGGESGRGRGRGGAEPPLPPWAERLSAAERTIAHWTERALYLLLFIIPLTGLWLVLVSDDAVAVHAASHIAFFIAIAAHLGLVLKHQVIDRDGLPRRML